ncbi:MAG: hypothetical protein KC729_07535, partial [Candidatus Eisenbacteria bacterium]|nr:hypothetical protein [Candidatus Eisenbacteria bacterium]
EDKLEGRRIFEEGDQLEASFRIVDRIGRFHGSLFTQGVWKKDDTSYGRTESDLGRVSTTTPGTGFVTHGSVLYGLSDRIDAGFTGDWKRFQVSDNAFYNGDAFGVGPTIGTRLGDGRSIRLEGLWLTGSAGSGDSQLDLSGFAVTAGLYWRL